MTGKSFYWWKASTTFAVSNVSTSNLLHLSLQFYWCNVPFVDVCVYTLINTISIGNLCWGVAYSQHQR